MSKTKVRTKSGSTGYIDGYIQFDAGVAWVAVIIGNKIKVIPHEDLEVINDNELP